MSVMTDAEKNLVAPIFGPKLDRAVLIILLAVLANRAAFSADKSDAGGEVVRGVLVSRTPTGISVRTEGEQGIRRYVIPPESAMDAKTALFFRELAIGSLVRVTAFHNQANRSIDVFLLAAPGKFGLLTGTVTDKAPSLRPASWRSGLRLPTRRARPSAIPRNGPGKASMRKCCKRSASG